MYWRKVTVIMKENWSINLELDEYVQDRDLLVQDALQAIEDTELGCYVNLAVAENHGHPDAYLLPAIQAQFGEKLQVRFIDQCGCGGYVYRVLKVAL